MRGIPMVVAAAALALPTFASANCYYVFSAQNQLVYRSVQSPVDLSKPISSSVRARFGGGHMTMVPDETGCPDLGTVSEPTATAGAANSGPFASPLFRSAETRSTYDDAGGITSGSGSGASQSQPTSQRRR